MLNILKNHQQTTGRAAAIAFLACVPLAACGEEEPTTANLESPAAPGDVATPGTATTPGPQITPEPGQGLEIRREANKWGDKGATSIRLAVCDVVTLKSALTMSWRHAAPEKHHGLLT